jgi:hypothetical protein
MVVLSVLAAVVAVAILGYQPWLILFGDVLVAYARFDLMTE